MANSNTQKRLSNNFPVKKTQIASKSLNSYLSQLKIHFNLNDEDVVKVLELSLKERKNNTLMKKWWHILK